MTTSLTISSCNRTTPCLGGRRIYGAMRAKAICCLTVVSVVTAACACAAPHAKAEARRELIERSPQEAALGAGAVGAYTGATAFWVASLATQTSLEVRLLPSLALGAAGAWALSTYDERHPFARGTIANTTSGATVGLGIGLAWVLHNRASTSRWSERTASTLLWGGATIGAAIGAFTARAGTTPGRAAFTSATAYWAAAATGLLVASLADSNESMRVGFLGSAVAMEAGVIAAGWWGRRSDPSVERVAWAASAAVVASLALGAGAWVASGRPDLGDARVTWGASALGLLAGGAMGWAWSY